VQTAPGDQPAAAAACHAEIASRLLSLHADLARHLPWATLHRGRRPITLLVLSDRASYQRYSEETGHDASVSRAHYTPLAQTVACYRRCGEQSLRRRGEAETRPTVDAARTTA
jgi:hypothetical protein